LRRRNTNYRQKSRTRINESIRVKEVRLIDSSGENVGVVPIEEALEKAREAELDLIEISPQAKPPVAKIMEYGKFRYDEQKKEKEQRAKAHKTETKNIQVKLNTGEHDLKLKAKRASEWLEEGHRVKFDLFLIGRAKYMKKDFLEERMQRMLRLVSVDYKVADGPKKSPKGMTMILERAN